MFFKQIVHPDLGCASYMVCSTITGECAVVDPRWEIEPYLEIADQNGFRISHIVETHTHADHVSGHGRLAAATGAQIDIHESAGVGYPHHAVRDEESIDLGDVRLHVIHTPGHRPEHIALSVEDRSRGGEPWMVLTGDSLFVGDVARPDLAVDGREGAAALFHSLHDRLLQLPDYVEVYPGHVSGSLCGRVSSSVDSTTLGYERRFNDALRIDDEADFVDFMNENLPQRPPNMGRIVEANRGPLVTDRAALRYLDAEEAAQLLDGGAVALDVRSPDAYLAEHLPGSIHVALDGGQFGTRVGFSVPADASVILVVDGEEEASRAADSLRVVAYDTVPGYLTVPAWRAAGKRTATIAGTSPEALRHALQEGARVRVLDVREPDEWEVGHIEGATLMPYREIASRLDDLPDDVPLAVVCDAGQRSVIAASLLERAGLQDVVNVDGGMSGWRSAGLPTTTEDREAVENALP